MAIKNYYSKSFKCNKNYCKCHKDINYRHGPYIYVKVRQSDGTFKQKFLGKFEDFVKEHLAKIIQDS